MRFTKRVGVGAVVGVLLLGAVTAPAYSVGERAEIVDDTVPPGASVGDPRQSGPSPDTLPGDLSIRIPVLTDPSDPNSPERADARPRRLAISQDGKFAYAQSIPDTTTSGTYYDLFVFDLEARKHIKTVQFDRPGSLGQPYAARDADVMVMSLGDDALVIFDTARNEQIGETVALGARYPYRDAISNDGKSYYMADVSGAVRKFDIASRAVTATQRIGVDRTGSITVSADGQRVIVGSGGRAFGGASLTELDADTLAITNGPNVNNVTWQFDKIRFDKNTGAILSTGYSWYVERHELAGGQRTGSAAIGNQMNDFVIDPRNTRAEGSLREDRAWGLTQEYSVIAPAIFNNGEAGSVDRRSNSFRAPHGAPVAVEMRPVCGDATIESGQCAELNELVVTNGATGRDTAVDPSITVLLTPEITAQPKSARVSKLGEKVTFAAALDGVKADDSGGVKWQSSPDGVEWTDLKPEGNAASRAAGEYGDSATLELEATEESAVLQYRLAYHDEFWNQSGVSDVVEITGPAPVITSPKPQSKMRVGEPVTPVTLTADANGTKTWTIEGLPDGITFDAATKVVSGTPTAEGSFTVVATVTDVFGTATQTVEVAVDAAAPEGDSDAGVDGGSNAGVDSGSDGATDNGGKPKPGLAITGGSGWAAPVVGAAALALLGAAVALFGARRRRTFGAGH